MLHVPFEQLSKSHLEALVTAIGTAPADDQIDPKFAVEQLANGSWKLFVFEGGLMAVTKRGKRLILELMTANVFRRKDLAETLQKLAADWECDIVETMVFDSRLADAIVKIGGQVESYVVTLPVRI